ncbi:sugar ABC transporter substrate-binding protein [Polynucleobacter kasalickyi]|uniref:Monosaccharide ABC transporter substrate-binding protein, CUT2 family n=1 Tax=Polynucleobacter kasalickyi TaxID=1938817 RepID=A0A1W2BNA8_9BURK|nr:sugar ABC transporter substrate-binding protein [Polynucleobacter kasalickyi]SMC74361.1 monosaccharide ABC transporter substrate-binding protein, CUT2 family [Polynucleobacter kasalickyi]
MKNHHIVFATALSLALASTQAIADGEKIAIFTKNQTNPYFQAFRLGADSAAKQMNAATTHYVPTKPDSIPEQLGEIDDVVVKKPNGIVLIPVDYKAIVPGVKKINDAGIPVVNATDRAESGNFVNWVGADDYSTALAAGQALVKALGGKGNVVIIEGVRGVVGNTNRVNGFKKAIEEAPGIKLLASQPGNYQRLQALQVMENLIQTYPKIDGVMAANDAMAGGAMEALEGANRKSLIVGINGSKEAVEAIKAGKMLASGDAAPFLQGCFSTMSVLRSIRNLPVPKEIVFPPMLVEKTTLANYDIAPDKQSCPAWNTIVK